MRVGQFVLEYATERAGDPRLLARLPPGCSIGFGVVNPRTAAVEDPGHIADRVRDLVQAVGHERIHLVPDCGFSTFAERPMNTVDVARAKLAALVAAARRLRG
jgi:5-methyltetrahydropteroyltriglutamate--homocysteine methyltransferase